LREALKGSFWRSFWPSFLASFAFASALSIVVIIAALMGFGLPIQLAPAASEQPAVATD